GTPVPCVPHRFIGVARARAAVRLVGEVRELGTTTEPGRRRMLDGMLEILGGAIGGVVLDESYAPGRKHGIVHATLIGSDRQIQDVFQTHHTQGSDYNPFHAAAMRHLAAAPEQIFTHADPQIVERPVWNGSEWINEYARPARVDHFICTLRPVRP